MFAAWNTGREVVTSSSAPAASASAASSSGQLYVPEHERRCSQIKKARPFHAPVLPRWGFARPPHLSPSSARARPAQYAAIATVRCTCEPLTTTGGE